MDDCIAELLEIEPFWKICYPCKYHGACCVGAEISFDDSEYEAIKECVSRLPIAEQAIIRDNAESGRHCIFRAPDKCLIHEVRPENCRYTPLQCLVTTDGELRYAMIRITEDGACQHRSIRRRIDAAQAQIVRSQEFVLLPNFSRQTYYLSLNWVVQNSSRS